jgi:hypothetical protein
VWINRTELDCAEAVKDENEAAKASESRAERTAVRMGSPESNKRRLVARDEFPLKDE